jgi:hypothetical protein
MNLEEKKLAICKQCKHFTQNEEFGFVWDWCDKFNAPYNWEHNAFGKCCNAEHFVPSKKEVEEDGQE